MIHTRLSLLRMLINGHLLDSLWARSGIEVRIGKRAATTYILCYAGGTYVIYMR